MTREEKRLYKRELNRFLDMTNDELLTTSRALFGVIGERYKGMYPERLIYFLSLLINVFDEFSTTTEPTRR